MLEEFQTHAGSDGEAPEMETVLGKDGPVPGFASVQIAQLAVVSIRRLAALIASDPEWRDRNRCRPQKSRCRSANRNRGATHLRALGISLAELNRVRLGIWSARQRAETAAALALAEA